MIYFLSDKEISFPDPRTFPRESAEESLLAVGGTLSVPRLLLAYHHGIFPWAPFRDRFLQWHCPMQRFVIFTNEVHISHSMRSVINRNEWYCTIDESFGEVLENCAHVQNRYDNEGAWLGEDIIEAYTKLYELGYAKSVEVRQRADNKLVGGLYGVLVKSCFCGESMFSLVPSASKFALIKLAQMLHDYGVQIIDCQFETPHLKTMGGRFIPYDEYMQYLR